MAVPTGTFTTYAAIGNREDLQDIIYDISPMDTPFVSNVGRGTASAKLHEWQTDSLAAASATNAALDGDDATTDTASATSRFANNCQILDKVPRVSGTQRAVDSAGRRDELSYQVSKRGRELKRDLEAAALYNGAATGGAAGTARQMAGVSLWLWDNQRKQGALTSTVTVTSGAPTTAPTAGTAATFVEADLKAVIKDIWDDGGDPSLVLVDSFNKQSASAFGGIATLYRDSQGQAPATIIGAADIYVSDFGQHHIVADRFIPAGNAYVLDPEYWEMAYLRPMQQTELAKTGDSERRQILCEVTLCAKNPSSSGKVYTNTTS